MRARSFRKRVYAAREFARDLAFIAARLREYLAVVRGRRVDAAFAERLRLVTSATNQCVLCARVHRELGEMVGMAQDEIRDLLRNDLRGAGLENGELAAMLYAQHYAETRGAVDPAAKLQLTGTYGTEVAHDIELILRLINFFNRTLNTVEAFISRVSGRGSAAGSNAVFELLVTLLSAPIAGPLLAYTHIKGNRFTFQGESDRADANASTVSNSVSS